MIDRYQVSLRGCMIWDSSRIVQAKNGISRKLNICLGLMSNLLTALSLAEVTEATEK